MSNTLMQLERIDEDARCAASATADAGVLVCALPPTHDDRFLRSRGLARAFCERVQASASNDALDSADLVEISRSLLHSAEWRGWHLSFAVVIRRAEAIHGFNCGVTGVLTCSPEDGWRPLLLPQTVGRKLRSQGQTDVPRFVENVGATMATADMLTTDIESAELPRAEVITVVLVADPDLAEMLSRATVAGCTSDEVDALVARSVDSLNNPQRSFLAWWPWGAVNRGMRAP